MRLRRAAALLSILLAVALACAPAKPPAPAPAPPTPAPPPPAVPTAIPTPEPPAPPVPPPTAFLIGTVTYRQRVALTPQAEVQVELRDVTAQDVASVPIAKQVIATPGQVPIPFSLEYDPTKILGGRSYAISARIVDRGQLQFLTETPIPVLTRGAQGPFEIVVVPVR
jgi:putative lipoprotein